MKMRMKKENESEVVHDDNDDDIESVNSDEFNMLLSKWFAYFFMFQKCLKILGMKTCSSIAIESSYATNSLLKDLLISRS